MKVTHFLGDSKIAKENCKDCSFLLANRKGGYVWLNDYPLSRYQGVFFSENSKVYKVIENIGIPGEADEIINRFWCVERIKQGSLERFFMPYGYNCLVYETTSNNPIELALDVKESYVNSSSGNYSIEKKSEDLFVIEYSRKDEKFYLAVRFKGDVRIKNRFFEREYSLDKSRRSMPFARTVYDAAEISSKSAVFSFSSEKQKALENAETIFKNLEKLKDRQSKQIAEIAVSKFRNKQVNMAYNCARIMLYNLAVEDLGVYAGLPWFFQFWARDEIICLKALSSIHGMEKIKEIIASRWLEYCSRKYEIPASVDLSRKESGASIDACGWLFKRIEYSESIKGKISGIKKLAEVNSDLFLSKEFGTWMDTVPRNGARIELQALKLNMLSSMKEITGEENYNLLEEKLRKEVREKFWNGSILFDSPQDKTIRPNIFLSAYIYPSLLSKEEWSDCFANALKSLWCEWKAGGGISSIDKSSPLFVDYYSGEENRSYHNGDSWFWLNNLAALVLHKIDKKEFSDFTTKIMDASTQEILWMGAVGNHSEVSSAKQISSCGCISQAWSAAMFIEMADELLS